MTRAPDISKELCLLLEASYKGMPKNELWRLCIGVYKRPSWEREVAELCGCIGACCYSRYVPETLTARWCQAENNCYIFYTSSMKRICDMFMRYVDPVACLRCSSGPVFTLCRPASLQS